MSRAKKNRITKRIVDAAMTVLLLLLMAYQVTGEMAHEWIGMGMTVLVIIHQILNRKWYGAVFMGFYLYGPSSWSAYSCDGSKAETVSKGKDHSHCSYVLPRGNWPVLLSAQQNT